VVTVSGAISSFGSSWAGSSVASSASEATSSFGSSETGVVVS